MITVYLDSQDYSILTDRRQLTPELNDIRDRLLAYSRSGSVRFVFSGVVVCEAAPLTPDSVTLAAQKADFLSDLCGENALMSLDKLIMREMLVLLGKAEPLVDAVDPEGNWFPEIGSPDKEGDVWQHMEARLNEDLKQKGMTRQQRRAMSRKYIKNRQPRSELRILLDQQDYRGISAALVAQYPMRPEHANLMSKYALGRVSEEQFSEALTGSLRDPRWRMRWFATSHSLASPISDMVRKPGQELGELLRNLVKFLLDYANMLAALNPTGNKSSGDVRQLSKELVDFQDRQILSIVRTLASRWCKTEITDVRIEDIDSSCRGLVTVLRSLYSSVWDNVGGGRKEEPSDSQPVDALHALYAPYVDVFRADSFMSPHIERQVTRRYGTTVVAKLRQLPAAIEKKLAESHSHGKQKDQLRIF